MFVLMLGFTVSLTGCHSTGENLNWYSGPPRGTNEVAIVKFPHDLEMSHTRTVNVVGIDGRDVRQGPGVKKSSVFGILNNAEQIQLLPGSHTLELEYDYQDSAGIWQADCLVVLPCVGGHVYDAYVAPMPAGEISRQGLENSPRKFYASAWVVDELTDEIMSGKRYTKYFLLENAISSVVNHENGKRIVANTFSPRDTVRFRLAVQVDDPVKEIDKSDVVFNWYSGSQLISDPAGEKRSVTFDGVNNLLYSERSAATLGLGNFRVEVLIQGEKLASVEFAVAL